MGEKRGMQALEVWCKRVTSGYAGVNVTNMTSSWRDGLAFCALIHHFRPDLINFASLSPVNIYQNNELAFTVAEQHLGIPALLDPEDMVKCSIPDRLSILTYLSQFYQVLASPKAKGASPLIGSVKRPADSTSFDGSSPGGTPVKDANIDMRGQYKAEFHDATTNATSRRPDLCVVCQNAVFLAERLIVNSKLHHRTCFRCARCTSLLSVANYYETEKGQYCCETCPDEVDLRHDSSGQEMDKETIKTTTTTAVVNEEKMTKETSPDGADESNLVLQVNASAVEGLIQERNDADPETSPLTVCSSPRDKVEPSPGQPPTANLPNTTSFTQQRAMELKKNFFQSLNEVVADTETDSHNNVSISPDSSQVVETTCEPIADELAEDAPVIRYDVEEQVDAVVVEEILNVAPNVAHVPQFPEDEPEAVADVSLSVDDNISNEGGDDGSDSLPVVVTYSVSTIDEHAEEETNLRSTTEATNEPLDETTSPFETEPETIAIDSTELKESEQTVAPMPRRRSRRRTGDSVSASPAQAVIHVDKVQLEDYPDDLNPFDDESPTSKTAPTVREKSSSQNPFGSDDEEEEEVKEPAAKKVIPAPNISLNPFGSDDEEEDEEDHPGRRASSVSVAANKYPKPERPPPPSTFTRTLSTKSLGTHQSPHKSDSRSVSMSAAPSPSPSKKRHAPPPPPKVGSNLSATASLRRKEKPAPPPPVEAKAETPSRLNSSSVFSTPSRDSGTPSSLLSPMTDDFGSSPENGTPTPAPRTVLPVSPTPKPRLLKPVLERLSTDSEGDVVLREKSEKDMSNLTVQCSVNKDAHGQWKRKKGPAPPRPLPQKRQLRKLPLKTIQLELEDIEIKQLELERQGVTLEQNIRSMAELDEGSERGVCGIEVEEMVLQLFDLVNEKNELLRRQTELMYTRRQQRLEEEHAELEFQIRCLMEKPSGEKTDEDRLREEELIQRLVQVVHRRSEIVDCLEMDRRREVEEDESIQQHLEVFNSRGSQLSGGASSAATEKDAAPTKKSKTLKMMQSPIKLMKKDKSQKKSKKKVHDADKDIDESESEAHPSVPVTLSSSAAADQGPKEKDKDKKKSKLWFTK